MWNDPVKTRNTGKFCQTYLLQCPGHIECLNNLDKLNLTCVIVWDMRFDLVFWWLNFQVLKCCLKLKTNRFAQGWVYIFDTHGIWTCVRVCSRIIRGFAIRGFLIQNRWKFKKLWKIYKNIDLFLLIFVKILKVLQNCLKQFQTEQSHSIFLLL